MIANHNPNPAAIYNDGQYSSLFGILEGKAKARKAEAAAKLAQAQADAAVKKAQAEAEAARVKAQTDANAEMQKLLAGLYANNQGYNPQKDAQDAELKKVETEANSSNAIYYVLAAIVIVVMGTIYFIKRRK